MPSEWKFANRCEQTFSFSPEFLSCVEQRQSSATALLQILVGSMVQDSRTTSTLSPGRKSVGNNDMALQTRVIDYVRLANLAFAPQHPSLTSATPFPHQDKHRKVFKTHRGNPPSSPDRTPGGRGSLRFARVNRALFIHDTAWGFALCPHRALGTFWRYPTNRSH